MISQCAVEVAAVDHVQLASWQATPLLAWDWKTELEKHDSGGIKNKKNKNMLSFLSSFVVIVHVKQIHHIN